MSVIETAGLTKKYGKIVAVDGISFTVERGQIFGFLGPNGSGKTTTIGMLLGIINPTGGQIRLLGREGSRGLHASRRRTGATLETPNFYPYMSGLDNLRVVGTVKQATRAQIDQALEMVRLTERRRQPFSQYSLGMKQRLALAATMLSDPELIILDEPANGLDPEGMREIREIILELAQRGKTIFLSSHLLWEVERTCTHVAVIRKGRIVKQASVREIRDQRVMAAVGADDRAALRVALSSYPHVVRVEDADDGRLMVELRQRDLADLNRHLSAHGVYASHLSEQSQSLEDAFMELTA